MPYQPNLTLQTRKMNSIIYQINLLLLLLIASASVQAQQVIFEKQTCEPRTPIELSTITDSTKQITCIFMVNRDSIKAIVFNNKMEDIKTFAVWHQPDEEPIGSCINNGSVLFFE